VTASDFRKRRGIRGEEDEVVVEVIVEVEIIEEERKRSR
jgi:hypothetical protein